MIFIGLILCKVIIGNNDEYYEEMKQITNNIVEIPNMKHGFLKEENQTSKTKSKLTIILIITFILVIVSLLFSTIFAIVNIKHSRYDEKIAFDIGVGCRRDVIGIM